MVMSVYGKDKPEFVVRALESVTVEQTVRPTEVVLVVDGPVSDGLRAVLVEKGRSAEVPFNVVWLPENKGLGNALRVGVEVAKYDIIARMDSDDVSVPERFEKQMRYLEEHPDCDIVGGQITEFIGDEDNVVGKREVPCKHDDIVMWLKGRCPFNHMSVTALRSRVIAVGNYMDWHFNEDYYLWVRMALAGCRMANLGDVLVNVRVGADMYRRRGGWRYFRSEARLQGFMLRHRVIGMPRYLFNVAARFAVQVAMPNRLRGFVFQKLFRK